MRNVDLSRLTPGPDVWELDVLPDAQWIVERDQPAYRPTHAWCMSRTRRKQISIGPSRPAESRERMALLVLTKMLRNSPFKIDKPARILLRDAALFAAIAPHVAPSGVEVELVRDLPLVDEGDARIRAQVFDPVPGGYLADIEPVLLRDYAEAAVEFGVAEPWRTLTDYDLVELAPAPEGMEFVAVSGYGGGTRGFCFYRSKEEHIRFAGDPNSRDEIAAEPRWLFSIDSGRYVPNADLDRWLDNELPLIGGREYPLLELNGNFPEYVRADPDAVVFLVVVLRGLADIGRRGIDGAPMRKIVRTVDGPVTLAMTVTELVRREV